MAPYLSPREIAAIDAIVAQPNHPDLHEIATRFNTTYETIRYRRYQIQVRRALGWDPRKKPGRPLVITPEMEEAVMEHVLRYVDIYQEEIIDFLYNEFGIQPY
ncbi:uncharacterized protein K444DRAFT_607487 [Hyaloscypha bicolor E]|uniref:Uncharacterized protein n=1 Tax=Hyaloscypha bicolor E TaxID=1095630 RepID=A0A2J6TST4_9HELO|nr:uncharacterized protein K444DRAFT_607487 [Hyaloscypha bicolor E]PMD66072.1 hypothetical protein K444DRAFT_607487 [Hyaloscypha bicolor E]